MDFSNKLNNYIDIIGCTSKELATTSTLSASVISRYKTGERIPKYNSKQLALLINGLYVLAINNNINITKEAIKKELESTLNNNIEISIDIFRNNLNLLIIKLDINTSELARYLGFDASYLSKIKSGTRNPQNINDFTNGITKYITKHKKDDASLEIISKLFNCNKEILYDTNNYSKLLYKWLCNNQKEETNSINSFLQKLDNFDLNDYIESIKFDKIIVPTLPTAIPKSKTYYGLKGYKESQINALKSIILSKSKEDILFYSNMPMIEASQDKKFTKKFIISIAIILKKGLKLNIIHNLDCPFNELMMGLEGWIPLYMTGLINSYYLEDNSNKLYSHIECTSGTIALSGVCPTGYINKSKILVTNKKDEVKYYQDNNKMLLQKANKLIKIYNQNKENDYLKIINNSITLKGTRINTLTTLPLHTLNNKLLKEILEYNKISNNEQEIIIDKINNLKKQTNIILKNNKIIDSITILTKNNFKNNTHYLDLSLIFFNKKIKYNYELYLKHLNLTKSNKNINYKCNINKKNIFKNINIYIIKDKQVILTKTNNPTIHFIIYYPKLINAISNFKPI